MGKYLCKRLLQTVLIVFLVSFLTFFLLNLMPKDPVTALYGTELSAEEYQTYFHALGLDKPLLYRYCDWLLKALQGDFGVSYAYHIKVTEVVGSKIGTTIYLSVVSMLISVPLGILMGIITAVKRGKWQDTVLTLLANTLQSIPPFVISIVLLWIFAIKLRVLPAGGFVFPWDNFREYCKESVMPIACLSLGGIAGTCRQTRSAMLEAIRQDYVRTARSKGFREKRIIVKHVLRNGLIPVITMIGHRLAHMIGGSVFVENVFAIPGMGKLMVDSVNRVDIPVLQMCVMLSAACVCIAYLITDILYAVVDPRIKIK